MKRLILSFFVLALLLAILPAFAQKAKPGDAILGTWFNEEKDAKIEIYKEDNSYFGKVIWLKFPYDEYGKPKTDIKNPDPKLKTRPRLGLVIMSGLDYKSGKKFEGGKVYDPKSGKTYSCQATLASSNLLKLRGFIGVSLIGRTSEWTRTQ